MISLYFRCKGCKGATSWARTDHLGEVIATPEAITCSDADITILAIRMQDLLGMNPLHVGNPSAFPSSCFSDSERNDTQQQRTAPKVQSRYPQSKIGNSFVDREIHATEQVPHQE